MSKSRDNEISIAADEMIERFGDRAALEAAAWANGAYDLGDIAKYEFWQWVCMDINQRSFEKAAPVRQNKH